MELRPRSLSRSKSASRKTNRTRSKSSQRTPVSEKRTFTERNSPDYSDICAKKTIMATLSDDKLAILKAKGMPDWGKDFFDMLNTGLNASLQENLTKAITENVQESFRKELDTLETKLNQTIEAKCDKIQEACMDRIDSLAAKMDVTQMQLEGVQCLVRKMDTKAMDRIVKVEEYQRRENLLFSGFKEVKHEKEQDCLKKVREQLNKVPKPKDDDELGRDLSKAVIVRCHRVGPFKRNSNRDIIVRFLDYNDKKAASAGRDHYDKGIFVKSDHTKEINNAQRSLKPILKVVKDTPFGEKGRVVVRDGVVIVDGKRFTIRQLHSLPAGINFYLNNHVTTEDMLAFFGCLSPFSNFFWSPIEVDGDKYCCGEQYISAELARLFGRDDLKVEIMNTTDPYQMKRLAYEVKEDTNFDAKEWESKVPDIAVKTCSAKFKQNSYFKNFLLDTGEKQIVEATKEKPWGCGLLLSDEKIKSPTNWTRVGAMGEALMQIRTELRADLDQLQRSFVSPERRSRTSSGSSDMVS